jgi:hypothetical protein
MKNDFERIRHKSACAQTCAKTCASEGGTNSYSNAQVLSKKENLSKGSKIHGLRDGIE